MPETLVLLYLGSKNAGGSLHFPSFGLRHAFVVVSAYAAYAGLLQLQGPVRLGHKQHQQNYSLRRTLPQNGVRYLTEHNTLLKPNLVSESPCPFKLRKVLISAQIALNGHVSSSVPPQAILEPLASEISPLRTLRKCFMRDSQIRRRSRRPG